MLVLKRREGQWVEITHKSGDLLRLRVYHIEGGPPGRLDIAFDDDARNFLIQRPERARPVALLQPATAPVQAAMATVG